MMMPSRLGAGVVDDEPGLLAVGVDAGSSVGFVVVVGVGGSQGAWW
jgi:hypothetical protein